MGGWVHYVDQSGLLALLLGLGESSHFQLLRIVLDLTMVALSLTVTCHL